MTRDEQYAAWMRQVDAHILRVCGLTSGDLPDFLSMDMFLDGCDPIEGAEECLMRADIPDELLDVLWE